MMFSGGAFAGQTVLLTSLSLMAAVLFGAYALQRREAAPGIYYPVLAWLRAGIYFCVCLSIATMGGVLGTVLSSPLATTEQLNDPLWLALTMACVAVIVSGYVLIWPRGTFTDNRRLHPLLCVLYGSVWGICQGLLFLCFWAAAERTGLAVYWVAVISYLLIGAYNGIWHSKFWDIYVTPPHNYSEWNGRKVLLCHTPNLLFCLSYLALFGNAGIFVLLQGLALAASAYALRFPAPWDDYHPQAGVERSIAEARAG